MTYDDWKLDNGEPVEPAIDFDALDDDWERLPAPVEELLRSIQERQQA